MVIIVSGMEDIGEALKYIAVYKVSLLLYMQRVKR